MKSTVLILAIMLFSTTVSAQVLIEDPAIGRVLHAESAFSDGMTSYVTSSTTSALSSSMAVGFSTHSTSLTTGYKIYLTAVHGIMEFNLESFTTPESMTTSNFQARLVGLTGIPDSTAADLAIDVFDLHDNQEDGFITNQDFDGAVPDAPINETPLANGEIPVDGIDVTEQIRRDLFGEGAGDLTSGYIFIPSGGKGLVNYPGGDLAYIEITVMPEMPDTDTTTSDTGADTSLTTDNDTETTEDSDTSIVMDTEDIDIGDPDVKCSCRTTGLADTSSFLSLLF